jgi:hypothetical protein
MGHLWGCPRVAGIIAAGKRASNEALGDLHVAALPLRIMPSESLHESLSANRQGISFCLSTQFADESDHCSQASGDMSTSGIVETKARLWLHPIIQY